jgi:hypothetical protein
MSVAKFRGVFGPDYRAPLEEGLPGAFERSVADADAFFGQELPAVQRWSFTQEDASQIAQPVLAVLGENTTRTFPERRELLLSNVEQFDLPEASHLLHVENADGMVEALAAFFARHPLPHPAATSTAQLARRRLPRRRHGAPPLGRRLVRRRQRLPPRPLRAQAVPRTRALV